MREIEVAKWLNEGSKSKGSQLPGRTKTYTGTALTDSSDGKVTVDMGGDSVTADNEQGVEISCGPQVKRGDKVVITTVNGSPYVSSVDGWGDFVGGQAAFSYAYVGELTAREITADTINAATAYVGTLNADEVTAESIAAAKGVFDALESGTITAQSINAASGYIDNLTAHNITTDKISATTGYIDRLNANNVTTDVINATTGYINRLTSNNITTDVINATTGYIDTLTSHDITTDGLIADHAVINNLDANYAHITNGVIDTATIDQANVNNLINNYAHISNGVIDNAKIGYADVNALDANYAKIDLENVNNSWISNGTIKNAAITDAQILGVSANKLTAGTIDASKINVTNLRADSIEVKKINGQPVIGGYAAINSAASWYDQANPEASGWYELSNGNFVLTTDTSPDHSKVYYNTAPSVALYDRTYIDGLESNLNDRIDGAIETWTGSVVPTLNNYPADDWDTDDAKASHVGDIYYVINSAQSSDGYCYRFAYDSTQEAYQWVLIKDSDVTAALSRLQGLESFQTTTSTWIDETDEGITTIRNRTTSLETAMGSKVDTSTFNTLSNIVDENSASITTLSKSIEDLPDSASFSQLTNTVNTVSQTSTANQSKITNLIQRLGTASDGTASSEDVVSQVSSLDQDLTGFKTTVSNTYSTKSDTAAVVDRVSQAESQISQNTNQIALRVTQAEAIAYDQPNLTPFFSCTPYTVGSYWQSITYSDLTNLVITDKGNGWARIQCDNPKTSTDTPGHGFVQHRPKTIPVINPDSWYTALIEFRNVNNTDPVYLRFPDGGQAGGTNRRIIENDQTSNDIVPVSGAKYHMLFKTNPETATNYNVFFGCCTHLADDGVADYEVRISIYECVLGENDEPIPYMGNYKPYIGKELYATNAELELATDSITTSVTQTYQNSRNGYTVLWDNNYGATTSGGEAKFQKLDPLTNQVTNAPGWVMWNGIVRTVPNSEFNPNALCPYNTVIYLVLRLTSASSTTGKLHPVWYKSGSWKYLTEFSAATSGVAEQAWTWNEDTDITLASCIEPSSEGQFSDCIVYEPPLTVKQVTTASPVAVNAYTKVIQTATDITTIVSATTVDNRNLISFNPDPATRLQPYMLDLMNNGWTAKMRVVKNQGWFNYTDGVVNFASGDTEGSTKYFMLCPYSPNQFKPGDTIVFEGIVANWNAATTCAFGIWFYNSDRGYIANHTSASTNLPNGQSTLNLQVTIPASADFTNRVYFVIGFSIATDVSRFGIASSAVCYKLDNYSSTTRSTANSANTRSTTLATMVRQYGDGVLVCRPGNTVGALVNADGSFDVVKVTWSSSTPTAGEVLSSFAGSKIVLGPASGGHIELTSSGLNIMNSTTSLANYGSFARIGKSNKYYAKVSDAKFEIIDGSHSNESLIKISSSIATANPPTSSNVEAVVRNVTNRIDLTTDAVVTLWGGYTQCATSTQNPSQTFYRAGLTNELNDHGYVIDGEYGRCEQTGPLYIYGTVPNGSFVDFDASAYLSVYNNTTQEFAVSKYGNVYNRNNTFTYSTGIYRNSTTEKPDALTAGNGLIFRDNASSRIGLIRPEWNTDGSMHLALAAFSGDTSGEHGHWLKLKITKSGTRSIEVSDAAAWRTGIGAAASTVTKKSESTTSTIFTNNSNNALVSINWAKFNGVFTFTVQFRITSQWASGTTYDVGVLNSGYRPYGISFNCTSGNPPDAAWVTTGGTIKYKPGANRAGATNLYVSGTYICA